MAELLTIKDVMKIYGIGRPTATRLLNEPGCPVLARKKNEKFLVIRKDFEEWLKER